MTQITGTPRFADAVPAPRHPTPRAPLWLRVLNWLADKDRAHRDEQRLRDMPAERLSDLNLPDEVRDFYAAREPGLLNQETVSRRYEW